MFYIEGTFLTAVMKKIGAKSISVGKEKKTRAFSTILTFADETFTGEGNTPYSSLVAAVCKSGREI